MSVRTAEAARRFGSALVEAKRGDERDPAPGTAAAELALDHRSTAIAFGGFLVCYSGYTLLRPSLTIKPAEQGARSGRRMLRRTDRRVDRLARRHPDRPVLPRDLPKETQRGATQPFILIMQIGPMIYLSKLGILRSGMIGDYL